MSEWKDVWDDFPDWCDSNTRVEVRKADGQPVRGLLVADDFGFDGADEYPIFSIETADGRVSLVDYDSWRSVP